MFTGNLSDDNKPWRDSMASAIGNGYWGKLLRVNLSRRKCTDEDISESVLRQLMGGSGIGAQILHEEVNVEVNALDPENRLVFALGPMQATNITGSAKFSVVSRSPLTGIQADSSAGGHWGVELKKAGYDALVVQGKAEKPVYLWISDGKAEIRDAGALWGKDSYDSTDAIKEEIREKSVSVASIGRGGENQVAIACIVFDKHSFAGRCGLGAVMGSKNLKAVAVKGSQKTPVADPKRITQLAKELGKRVYENAKPGLRQHGTPIVLIPCTEQGDVPIKYWTGDVWDGKDKIGTPLYTDVLHAKPFPCAHCTLGCHRYVTVTEPQKYACEGAGAEYETLGMMGNACLVDDVKAISKANDICNRYGLDTISTGAWVSFLMECYERGYISIKDTDGMDIRWGDPAVLIELIGQFGEKKGIGALFGDGIVKAASQIGGGAEDIVVHVKGLDVPAHDPRAFFSLYVNYPTGNRGGCHERGDPQKAFELLLLPEFGVDKPPDRFTLDGKVEITAAYQDYSALANSLVVCKFCVICGISLTDMVDIYNATTGWDIDLSEMRLIGERINALQRLVNTKNYGVSRKDDKLPKRLYEPAKVGSRAGKAPMPAEVEAAISEYYRLRGWDSDGSVKKEKLKALGLPL
jgi:aldehyde:ferredoxin oxidoreductase